MPKPAKTTKPATSTTAPSRVKVTDELYERILLFYVENPLAHAKGARLFDLGRRTMTGLYYTGAPHLGKPAMKLLVNTVAVRARALRASMKASDLAAAEAEINKIIQSTSASSLAKSVDDAAQARAEEGAVVAAGRRNILALQSLLTPLLAGASKRARDFEKILQNDKLDPWELLKLFRELGKFQHDISSAAKVTMDMERLLMGEPAEAKTNQPMNEGDAIKVLELSSRTFERYKGGGRQLIDGVGREIARVQSPLLDLDPEAEDAEEPADLEPEPFPADEEELPMSTYFEQGDDA